MSNLSPYPPAIHSPFPASAPQTPGASSADDSSDSEPDASAPFTPFTPYTPGPDGPGVNSPGRSPTTPREFLGLKGSERRRPEGTLGHVELLLEALAEELNTLQTRAEAVYAPRREEDGPLIHATVREVVDKLQQLEEAAPGLDEWVPIQVLEYLDEGRNPDDYTRTMLELTAAENQFTNGKVHAVHSYLQLLSAGIAEAFPDMAEFVPPPQIPLDDMPSAQDEGGMSGQEKSKEVREVPIVVIDEAPKVEDSAAPKGEQAVPGIPVDASQDLGGHIDVGIEEPLAPAAPTAGQ
ncbi:hypothetical protein DACRYDRAFT_97632 [Dacryopinax primogenitus]|uniref:Mediator of RNA polymerase II transcription subunit 10 n=1 Tax=Dacryopinax primogenitus (strain DJM 731) TaxID=1858805 RepID=M5GAS2_DACPD|nr:uncharacterized protein DACRYDRAFT_97632 [Dacryopinax primogenitus]EJU05979.1 hypothetical protein DACRYDRAFT_97632 [Dacryopinax primogenitus]